MKSIVISVLICILIVASGFQALAEEWTTEQKEVWATIEGMWDSIKKGDVEDLMSRRHDKVLELYYRFPSPLNKDQIRSNYSWLEKVKPTSVKLKPLAINVINNNVANVFYLVKYESEDKDFFRRHRILKTLVKQDSRWLIISYLNCNCDELPPCPYGF